MINKTLLSLVLGEEVKYVYTDNMKVDFYYEGPIHNMVLYEKSSETVYGINLDTLGRLCKEWCFSKQFILSSYIAHCDILGMDTVKITSISEDTELEAIILATAWVAEQKKCYD